MWWAIKLAIWIFYFVIPQFLTIMTGWARIVWDSPGYSGCSSFVLAVYQLGGLLKSKPSIKNEVFPMENRDKAVLTVEEVGSILRIGLNAAYELCRNNAPFRVVQIGNQYRISAESFFNWLNSAAWVSALPRNKGAGLPSINVIKWFLIMVILSELNYESVDKKVAQSCTNQLGTDNFY